jgi:type I restriction enzyme, S subunit
MAGEWKRERLVSLCEQIADCPHSTPMWTNSGALVLRSQNIRNGRLDLSAKSYTDEAHFEQRSRRAKLRSGDLVITREAPMGEVCLIPDGLRCCLGQRMVMLRPDPKKCDSRFLLYAIQSRAVQDEIKVNEGTGSTVSNLRIPLLEALPIPHPPLAEQKAIAAVLGALDDKIELNRRMNATLEAMARALFQSWFVDFDPVRAKLDGRKPIGLDDATAALFPDSFQESAAGHIPRGWTAQRLPDAIEVNPRRTLKGGTIAPYLDMKNLPTQGHSADEVIDREFSSGTKFQNGDTLLARITPCLENGKTGYVDFLADGQVGWGSTEYIVLAPKPPLPPQFGYLLARSDALRAHAIQNMTGTSGRQRVPSECFNTFWLAVPAPEIARKFDELTAPLMSKIKTNSRQSRTLATLRDAVLPKLLSGELNVSQSGEV